MDYYDYIFYVSPFIDEYFEFPVERRGLRPANALYGEGEKMISKKN